MEPHDQLQQAWEHYHAGQLDEAETVCATFDLQTNQAAEPLLLRGLIAQSRGRWDDAAAILAQAADCAQDDAQIQIALGLAHVQQSRFPESAECFRRATALVPENPEAWLYLGKSLQATGQYGEALPAFRKASELQPDSAEAWSGRGTAALLAAEVEEAATCLETAIRLRLDDAVAHLNLGTVRKRQGRTAEAAACYSIATRIQPGWIEAFLSLSTALRELGDLEGSLQACLKAAALGPESALVQHHLAVILLEKGDRSSAVQAYQRAASSDPNWYLPHFNLGNLLMAEGQCEPAVECYRAAIARNPDSALLHCHLAVAMLTLGQWGSGWVEYEWRWGQPAAKPRTGFDQPVWGGEALDGRIVTLWMEQGFGDAIQFIRYAALLQRRGATVWLSCHKPLQRLMETCPYLDRVFGPSDVASDFDFQVPLLSLPRLFATTPETVPASVPYLMAPHESIPEVAAAGQGQRIGIVWMAGNHQHELAGRDCPLQFFEKLSSVAGARLFGLQFGMPADECPNWLYPVATAQGDFASAAAAVAEMDLIITVDTAIAHLAGALGKSVWVLLKKQPDWRWLRDRDDSPWYPSMRLFRQRTAGDWAEVLDRVQTELENFVGGSHLLR